MPAQHPRAVGFTVVVGMVCAALAVAGQPETKKPADPKSPPAVAPAPKESPKTPPPLGLKLPDGTFLGTAASDGERILLTPQEHQKLLDQIDQLKKQLAGRKGVPPSGCALRAKIEKRGEAAVVAIKLTYSFRTATPNVAVSLGARRSFLVAATLDGNKLPVLDTVDDGFAVLVESAGDHAMVLDVECPIASRGAKPEIGFELGLPRAAITTLIFEPPPGAARVSLGTRISDAIKPPETRRVSGLDVKALAPPQPNRDPYPLGPVESLEVTWEPAATTPVADGVQTVEIDVVALLAEGFVETTAKLRLRGSSRSWRVAAPADAALTVDRAPGSTIPEPTSTDSPALTKPTDANKPVWKIDLPAGTTGADWLVTAVVRSPRPKLPDPLHGGPFVLGPFAALDAARQTGTVRVTTAANTRLVCKHGPDLRQDALPAPTSDDESAAFFRFATGPSGNAPPALPLLTVEATPLAGKLVVRPTYKLTLTDAGWSVRAELRVIPIRRSINSLTIELPASWRGPEVSPPEIVEGSLQLKADGPRQVAEVRLAAEYKQPFDVVLTASVPLERAAREAAILLPRFPNATERDAVVAISTPDGLELRGVGHEWDGDQPAAWGQPLAVSTGSDGKPLKVATAIGGKFERGLSRLDLAWTPYRPPLTADVRAEVVVHETQVVVSQRIGLRSLEGIPHSIRFQGAAEAKSLPPFDPLGPGVWSYSTTGDVKEASIKFEFAIPLPPRPADGTPRKLPIALVLPTGASRTDSVVRVWMSSSTGRTVMAEPGAWRELPPEPVPERDALPALTLAGSGSDLPLVLGIADAESGAATVWVDRCLLQASTGDDGISYRARFLLRRWLSDAVEVSLPEALAGTVPEVYLDEPPRRANATVSSSGSERVLRVSLPEARPGRGVVLDIRFKLPNVTGEEAVYVAPRPIAAFAGPVRWQVTGPSGTVPLVLGGRTEQRWRTRYGMVMPLPAASEDLEKWFQTGTGDGTGAGSADAVVVRMTGPDSLQVFHVPRLNLVIGCSVGFLILGLLVARLPGGIAGPLVALVAGAAAIAAVLYPQPAAQCASAAGPGAAALVLVLIVQTATRWYYRQRVTYLPGFSRTRPEATAPSSTGNRSADRVLVSPNGSTGSAAGAAAPHPISTGS